MAFGIDRQLPDRPLAAGNHFPVLDCRCNSSVVFSSMSKLTIHFG
jgi:hypothetical protein